MNTFLCPILVCLFVCVFNIDAFYIFLFLLIANNLINLSKVSNVISLSLFIEIPIMAHASFIYLFVHLLFLLRNEIILVIFMEKRLFETFLIVNIFKIRF